ncbi:hypothetical protein [Sporosarcina sp. ZBG7A]|uniref:hypothetical protein n=1 Tax=Sporosarcina sp. ZBG7A TaxID=1582223 RepID=UPI00057B1A05|nr:hypothetical protein [Sporosarcina sp. ZBG7A]
MTAGDYTTNATALSDAIAAGKVAIEAATTTVEVTSAVEAAKSVIDGIKSDAVILAEAKSELQSSISSVVFNIADDVDNEIAVGDTITINDVEYTVSVDGADVLPADKWVTVEEATTLQTAIDAAKALQTSEDTSVVTEGKSTLDTAIDTFTNTDAEDGTLV